MSPSQIIRVTGTQWDGTGASTPRAELLYALEEGKVLLFPDLAFQLQPEEARLLDPALVDAGRKNVSLEPDLEKLTGISHDPAARDSARLLLRRYATMTRALIQSLFPDYNKHLRPAPTSLRLHQVATRVSSWRKDDTRLHVDAFPSRPVHGERILRVFANIHPGGVPRVWRVGEPFPHAARHFLPALKPQLPGAAAVMHALRITKSRRSAYDHIMLHLHDSMKADMAYQRDSPQEKLDIMPGTLWICYSDQTPHAAMSGQFMLEQTYYIPVAGMAHQELAPLRVLEKMMERQLV